MTDTTSTFLHGSGSGTLNPIPIRKEEDWLEWTFLKEIALRQNGLLELVEGVEQAPEYTVIPRTTTSAEVLALSSTTPPRRFSSIPTSLFS